MQLDKLAHAGAGLALWSGAVSMGWGAWVGLGLAMAGGVAKEVYDTMHRERHTPDALDALATFGPPMLATIVASIANPTLL